MLTVAWNLLAGFMDEGQALELITHQGVEYSKEELDQVRDKVSRSKRFTKTLTPRSSDLGIHEAPSKWSEYLKQITSEGLFPEYIKGVEKWEFVTADLRSVAVFQMMLNMDYVNYLEPKLPTARDDLGLLRFCLPSAKDKPSVPVGLNYNPNVNTFSVITDNLDFRVLGTVQGEDPASGRRFLGFAYGGGLPLITVAEYKDRYILKNGYHRALALVKAGFASIPALLIHVTDYANTGGLMPGVFSIETVTGDKSPRLGDFVTEAAVEMKRPKLKVIITVHAEVQAFPI